MSDVAVPAKPTSPIPGVLAAVAVMAAAWPLADLLGRGLAWLQGIEGGKSAISPIPVAVVLGILVTQAIGPSDRLAPGLVFVTKHVLRAGIVLVGLKLSVGEVLGIGLVGVPLVVALVTGAVVVSLLLARWLGVGSRLAMLTAASTAICGITATLAVAPGVRAERSEVAYTVANVTVFGLFGMLVYPYVAHAVFDSAGARGLFLGTAIHDTSQVLGAAMSYAGVYADERVMEIATVAKLTRNALLVVVVPGLVALHARLGRDAGQGKASFPWFVVAFVAMAGVRGVGDRFWPGPAWHDAVSFFGGTAATVFLATALAGVGLDTRVAVLRQLGPRPFVLGFGAALAVGAMAALLAQIAGGALG